MPILYLGSGEPPFDDTIGRGIGWRAMHLCAPSEVNRRPRTILNYRGGARAAWQEGANRAGGHNTK